MMSMWLVSSETSSSESIAFALPLPCCVSLDDAGGTANVGLLLDLFADINERVVVPLVAHDDLVGPGQAKGHDA